MKKQYSETHSRVSSDEVYEDICDGSTFKCNQFYIDNPSALRIILYQDAFEVVNPLGSGRKKHKVIAVYLTLADLLPSCKSNIDHMQLVMLVREQDFKKFGQEVVFRPLLDDLMSLEEPEIPLNLTETEEMVKGAIVIISGDNLGSHCIGGYTENFSKSEYFCRYCRIDRHTFVQNACFIGPSRTISSYNNAVANIGVEHPTYGIKFQSLFNKLKHFHVAQPGLPPCLGHDLFEGVVSYDLALYIKHYVKNEKSFTYAQLNQLISTHIYCGSDADNKPCEVPDNRKKLGGHAVQKIGVY